jgi:hypothetical protein
VYSGIFPEYSIQALSVLYGCSLVPTVIFISKLCLEVFGISTGPKLTGSSVSLLVPSSWSIVTIFHLPNPQVSLQELKLIVILGALV